MKLYYSSGSCALSPHIVALEAGIPLETVKVDLKTKTVAKEGDYWDVSPKGYVPALELDDGQVLTEGPAIVQYLADLKPASGLAPANGSFERVRLQEALNYITSEIHKTYSPLFKPDVLPAVREDRLAYLRRRYALIDRQLVQCHRQDLAELALFERGVGRPARRLRFERESPLGGATSRHGAYVLLRVTNGDRDQERA